MSKKYPHLQPFKTYGIRDLSRGKTTEAIKESQQQPVIIMKNNTPQSVLIAFNEYNELVKEKRNGK